MTSVDPFEQEPRPKAATALRLTLHGVVSYHEHERVGDAEEIEFQLKWPLGE